MQLTDNEDTAFAVQSNLGGADDWMLQANEETDVKTVKAIDAKRRRLLREDNERHSITTNGVPQETLHEGISRSLQFMAQHYTRPIRIKDVVIISGMSRRGFMKAFSQHVGRTPGSFIRQARIEFAKRLLTEQDLPLKTIAEITGFRSQNTFCIAFSRATGMAPKKYQRQAWLSAYRAVRRGA